MTYIPNIENVIKMMVEDLTHFLFKNYYEQIGFTKEDSYYLLKKLTKKDLVLFAINLTKNT